MTRASDGKCQNGKLVRTFNPSVGSAEGAAAIAELSGLRRHLHAQAWRITGSILVVAVGYRRQSDVTGRADRRPYHAQTG